MNRKSRCLTYYDSAVDKNNCCCGNNDKPSQPGGGGGTSDIDIINDGIKSPLKTWSSKKISEEIKSIDTGTKLYIGDATNVKGPALILSPIN